MSSSSNHGDVLDMAKKQTSDSVSKTSISGPTPLRPSTAETKIPSTPVTGTGKGKRKADEVEGNTPPDVRKQRATFAADPRPHRGSATSSSSHAPSSYTRKRARLSTTPSAAGLAASMAAVGESDSSVEPRPPSRSESQNAGNTGTWNSARGRNQLNTLTRSHSRTTSRSRASQNPSHSHTRVPSVRAPSLSQASIPISALISPHAPSVSHTHASTFHMRDPRKPPKIQSTPWTLAFPQAGYGEHGYVSGRIHSVLPTGFLSRGQRTEDAESHKEERSSPLGWYEGGGSPPHAWLFFLGFIIFPLWWVAALLGIPQTRKIEGGHDGQKSVVLDDPQVEHDARSWRRRCRIMSGVALVTYIPFIVLVAVFAPRS
ncbi:hypothetical protein BDP27DRAFT_1329287 [Rhodocollybia butyracea]|uniref:Uncharacterized protein n=1 Tax=Rhodocollybia butyracea TaxID=206335 RepID=A0A9P5U6R1_9AGAR|nr:hypothetical protein BDP27DRAFT_1329287 [Rhodocollybia butyracea]